MSKEIRRSSGYLVMRKDYPGLPDKFIEPASPRLFHVKKHTAENQAAKRNANTTGSFYVAVKIKIILDDEVEG